MTTKNYLNIAIQYLEDIKLAQAFMKEQFGDVHFLREKNAGNIPSAQYNIKHSKIKGYDFHGKGCGFRTKNYMFEVEFDVTSGSFGLTKWTLFLYLKSRINKKLSDTELEQIIETLKTEKNLVCKNKICFELERPEP